MTRTSVRRISSTSSRPARVCCGAGSYRLKVHRTGFRSNDAYSAYIEMGAPKNLKPAQLEELKRLTRDLPETERVVRVDKSCSYKFLLPMRSNDIVLVTLESK
jgi:xylan 1,4-beta-xylosidase